MLGGEDRVQLIDDQRERETPPSVPFPYYVVYCGYIYVVYEASLPVYEQKEWERGKRREHFIILRIITHSLVFLSALFILYSTLPKALNISWKISCGCGCGCGSVPVKRKGKEKKRKERKKMSLPLPLISLSFMFKMNNFARFVEILNRFLPLL